MSAHSQEEKIDFILRYLEKKRKTDPELRSEPSSGQRKSRSVPEQGSMDSSIPPVINKPTQASEFGSLPSEKMDVISAQKTRPVLPTLSKPPKSPPLGSKPELNLSTPRLNPEVALTAWLMELLEGVFLTQQGDLRESGADHGVFTELKMRIKETYGVRVRVKDLLKSPSIAGIAARIKASKS